MVPEDKSVEYERFIRICVALEGEDKAVEGINGWEKYLKGISGRIRQDLSQHEEVWKRRVMSGGMLIGCNLFSRQPGVVRDMDVGEVAVVVIEEYLESDEEFSYMSWLLMLGYMGGH